MSNNRDWMYDRVEDRVIKQSYANGVIEFIQYAFSREGNINAERIKCPCTKCQNIFYRNRGEVELHLMNNGFIRDYKIWYVHGESDDTDEAGASNEQEVGADMEQMILNAAGPDFDRDEHPNHESLRGERPNPEAQAFMEMLHAADEDLWDGAACSREKKLSAISLLLNLKSDFELSEATQVYYMSYPSLKRERNDWWVATKMKRRLELPDEPMRTSVNNDPMLDPFQEEDQFGPSNVSDGDYVEVQLNEEGVAEEVLDSELVVAEDEELEEIENDDDSDDDSDDDDQNDVLDTYSD
ncbi:hypothetical protein LUZ60_002585 [Juncus effusus]|nr:hypothetical protein LUZ60_002585 [Juncus effusus]